MFDPKQARIFRAITISRIIPLVFFRILEVLLFFTFFIFLILAFSFYFEALESLPDFVEKNLIKVISFSFAFWGILFICRQFFNQKLKIPPKSIFSTEKEIDIDKFNFAEVLDFEAAKTINLSRKITKRRRNKTISSLMLVEAIFHSSEIEFVLKRFGLNKDSISKMIDETKTRERTIKNPSFSEDFIETINKAAEIAYYHNLDFITVTALFSAVACTNNLFKKNLAKIEIDEDDIDNVCLWHEQLQKKKEMQRKFWLRENLIKIPGFAKDWASGYTVFLDQFSSELTATQRDDSIFGSFLHKKEMKELEGALSRPDENSVILVGEPGSGRKSIINNFNKRITLGGSLHNLNYKRILEIDMPSLIAAGRGPGELEKNIKIIFNDALKAGNVILLIRQMHNFIGYEFGASAVGKVDISGILNQYLTLSSFCMIGLTTYEGFRQSIERASETLPHFTRIEVKSTTKKETLILLEEESLKKEREAGLFFSYAALKEIVELCDRYIQTEPFPKKALDVLEEVTMYTLRYSNSKIVLPETVATIISEKTEIPVGKTTEKEKELLLNLEEIMHRSVVGQEEGISEIANALRRARADIKRGEKPIGTFLFLGPTGVGKTETAKTLAETYFGSVKRMIRLDMSEYQELNSIDRLIGTAKESGYFTTKVREDPFSLVLLDEIEKAHPNILDLFLQVLDEGHITDGLGRTISFTNTIIIATSNAGANIIRRAVKEGKDLKKFKDNFINEILSQGEFRPEFLNRFDGVILFHSLSKAHVVKVANIMLNKFKNILKEKKIDFQVTSKLSERIAELGYDPEFGGREMGRAIKDNIENNIAKAILLGKVQPGDKIDINPETFEVKAVG